MVRLRSFRLIAPIDGIKCINSNNTDDTIILIIRLLLIELNINHTQRCRPVQKQKNSYKETPKPTFAGVGVS